ncbi:alpha/beta hydrolase family protein [Tuwongella immobilis]|uniref:Peptidase S9 prolyl oligopeptidase catalytic domain-containing protein n=1 Tax=Tuwongella immobilis TaxID=692036 RepID=A0A6C2YVW4_9BACT|nr:prolyl oligopeptidase family serine peptidase [Tuwongella immobilis]VIP05045.1 dipeptidylaminopeptidase acylaminoacyl-peptidase : Hypothetical conserved protein OS=uncultured planctomycete GN=HGMM_F22C11C26 PE=4 SV=1: Peptidase_S9 [Tuwongella immobilis]VTS07446.1 dipeptidylaminopeptidase acylaminoacyl-peptidase : Hypothetical conserved protein OS=uncultured planctomycete GN=HGMM_F22C11C26 PE=4 SV=1: Peptidase_S9 [Tuwongella immobilis]
MTTLHRLIAVTAFLWLPISSRADETVPVYSDRSEVMNFLNSQGKLQPVQSKADWQIRRNHILFNMQKVMGPLPSRKQLAPLDPKILETVDFPKYQRIKLTIQVEANDRLPAYLFVPKMKDNEKRAAVLCLHPTSIPLGKGIPAGLGDNYDRQYAVHLVERGYVTLAPDYVNMGEYRFNPYQNGYQSATMKAIWNHMRCIDFLEQHPRVDGKRIGAVGHSLGGHNSIFLGVFDERIQCVISSCGFCSFPKYMKGNLAGWGHDGYMPKIRNELESNPAKMPFDFTEVIAALAPRPFLASAPVGDDNFDVEGVKDCIRAARPVYRLFGAESSLIGDYPAGGHTFGGPARAIAYPFLDKSLAHQPQ